MRHIESGLVNDSIRLSIFNMLTHQEDTTSETRSLILKHQKVCVTCMTISNTRREVADNSKPESTEE